MQKHNGAADNYLLGHSPWAIQRLRLLAAIHHPITRRVLIEAGITTGMQVLDVGCGPGEVSVLAGELVGEVGRVLGIDGSADMIAAAQAHAQDAGFSQVSFMEADLRDVTLDQRFDGLVGRFIGFRRGDPCL
jgi:ubiquinone/menaquinone biosynthesis C-methylase UbiE